MNVTLPSQKDTQFPLRLLLEKNYHPVEPLPSITISRSCGAVMPNFVQLLTEHLNATAAQEPNQVPWTVFDRSKIADVLLWLAHKNAVIPGEPTIKSRTTGLIQALCQIGHVIILDRAGHCSAANVQKVKHFRIEGSKTLCIQRMKKIYLFSQKEAEIFFETSEASERKYEAMFADVTPRFDHRFNSDYFSTKEMIRAISKMVDQIKSV